MPELRLTDPDGYTVPGTAQTVPDTDEPAVRAHLRTVVAPQHAAQWADFGYQASAYRVLPDPEPTPAEAATQALADINATWASWTSGRLDTDTAMAAIREHLTLARENGALQ